jgi:hypothetical protein
MNIRSSQWHFAHLHRRCYSLQPSTVFSPAFYIVLLPTSHRCDYTHLYPSTSLLCDQSSSYFETEKCFVSCMLITQKKSVHKTLSLRKTPLALSRGMTMEAVQTSKKLINSYQSTRRYYPADSQPLPWEHQIILRVKNVGSVCVLPQFLECYLSL